MTVSLEKNVYSVPIKYTYGLIVVCFLVKLWVSIGFCNSLTHILHGYVTGIEAFKLHESLKDMGKIESY